MNVDYYHGIPKVYFTSIISNIIKIGNLNRTNKTILDFGCGSKILSKMLKNQKILNYDLDPRYTEHDDYSKLNFDIVVFNHVLMYINEKEILSIFKNIKKINKECGFIIGIGKEGFINKLAALIALNFNAHKDTKSSYKNQLSLINSEMKIIDVKKNIFFMTDIFYTKFNT